MTRPSEGSRLPEALPVDHARLARRLQLVESARELVVAAGDRLAQPERVFGLERETPAWLVQPVERDSLLSRLEGASDVAASEAHAADALKQVEQCGA